MSTEPTERIVASLGRDFDETADSGGVRRFPKGFLWGTATAATQVEGQVANEWTDFVAPDGGTCRRACDHYHRYREDVRWMRQLGVKAYRMSLEWSRLQSRPGGSLNSDELAHYCEVLDCLRAAGIEPMVVLHHFSNPLWICRSGGWTNPETVAAFQDFVERIVPALRDRVRIWNTINEPDTYASCTCLLGEYPPFHKLRLNAFRRVIDHMAEAHRLACYIIRRAGSSLGPVEVGFTKNWTYFDSFRPYLRWDWLMAWICDRLFNRRVINAFTRGRRNDSATFLGLNYYGRVRFHNGRSLLPARGQSKARLNRLGIVCDDMFERFPDGMEMAVVDLHRRLGLPIYVTEHGSASADETFRIDDLRANLTALHRGIERGAEVKGFFYWTLLDNFEWQFGYTKKFGLLNVDFSDERLPRCPKQISEVFRTACLENRVP